MSGNSLSLDISTLYLVATFVAAMLGALLMFFWRQEKIEALGWWGAAYLLGAASIALWIAGGENLGFGLLLAVNAVGFIACGLVWDAARVFHGRAPSVIGVVAGAIVWLAAVIFADPLSDHARLVLGASIVAIYAAPAVVGALGPTQGLGAAAISAGSFSVSYGSIALFGASMMLSGISQMLSPTPKANLPDSKQSYLFSGPVNVTEQGGSVPLVYGRCWVGSTVISSGMDTEQVGSVQAQPAVSAVTAASDGGPAGGIQGAKGGKSGRGGSGATEDPNSLQSAATARVIDLLGEGEIVGLVNGAKSIYFDGTPLVASDGTENFKGVSWKLLQGLPSQDAVEGFTDSETSVAVGVEVKKASPVVRTIHSDEIDAARIVLRWNALTEQDTSNGDLHASSVELIIEGRAADGSWTHLLGDTVSGKTTSAY